MYNRSQLRFHETFQPESAYISKILGLAFQNYSGSKHDISNCTGIPTGKSKGKVVPHIKYASYMGLISYTVDSAIYKLTLTGLGREVYTQDPFLQELLTKWICHYGISRKNEGAPQWSVLVNDGHPGFIQPLSENSLRFKMEKVSDFQVDFNEIFGVVKRSYKEGFFADLNYMIWGDGEFTFPEIQENPEFLYLYAYALFANWDSALGEKREITMTEVTDVLSFGKIFDFNAQVVSETLDLLAEARLLEVNRQLFPATIIRMSATEDMIPYLYSKLL